MRPAVATPSGLRSLSASGRRAICDHDEPSPGLSPRVAARCRESSRPGCATKTSSAPPPLGPTPLPIDTLGGHTVRNRREAALRTLCGIHGAPQGTSGSRAGKSLRMYRALLVRRSTARQPVGNRTGTLWEPVRTQRNPKGAEREWWRSHRGPSKRLRRIHAALRGATGIHWTVRQAPNTAHEYDLSFHHGLGSQVSAGRF